MTSARDQDFMTFFSGISGNLMTRRVLASFFKENYDALYKKFEGNFQLKYLVEVCPIAIPPRGERTDGCLSL